MTRPDPQPVVRQSLIDQHVCLETALAKWDRARFGVAMRRIEVLLVHGHNRAARDVFESIVRRESPSRPTIDSYVDECLPVRIANCLTKAGYLTLASVRAASDQTLLAIRELGVTHLNLIRSTIAAVVQCKPLPEVDDLSDLWPDWPYCHEYDAQVVELAGCANTIPRFLQSEFLQFMELKTMTDDLSKALDTILSAGDETVALIDQQIAQLTEQINQLKRVRKFVAPGSAAAPGKQFSAVEGNSKMGTLIDLIVDAVESGPLHYRELAQLLDVDIKFLCRAIIRSDRLQRDEDGLVGLFAERAVA